MTLSVGEGVLIPRPVTELLCETAAVWLKRLPAEDHRVLDLCAGTGASAFGIARLCPDAWSLRSNCRRKRLSILRKTAAAIRSVG